jgi:deazaflavin-dependent oxidoreductase (nitroreductase family)
MLGDLLRRDAFRPLVRWFTGLHVRLYRVSGGKAQAARYPTLLITVKGRKSGKPRTVPLIYVTDGDRLVVAAAYSGSDRDPTWWLNLQESPEAEVQLLQERVRVRAERAPSDERDRLWRKLAAMYPYFDEYQARTNREIPIVLLHRIPTRSDGSTSSL